eukprot:CAMPEP_0117697064 /NCGR_PEP_ID=MMETSP0804-20121206/29020_1 /TAXON_ID=1074897 /ORGANISM="Tetraselmis astigmatica, Strain CCMP880" /LENGTH=196 /DNA_ID=CAMNT_0005511271 /DNA_START=292 /DNA_END=879 /DNA_ORIENTATION=+
MSGLLPRLQGPLRAIDPYKTPSPLRDMRLTSINNEPKEKVSEDELMKLKKTISFQNPTETGIKSMLQNGSAEERLTTLKTLEQFAVGTPKDGQALALKAACPQLVKLLAYADNEEVPIACCATITSLAAVESNSDILGEDVALSQMLPGADGFRGNNLGLSSMQALSSLLLFSDHNRQEAKEKKLLETLLAILEGN